MLGLLVTSPVVLAFGVAVAGLETTSANGEAGSGVGEAVAGIPPGLADVYVAAAATCPGLPWQVLAAIGEVESGHGGGRYDPRTGSVQPPILGPALDGRPGFARIPDPSQFDGWAHALGPMQFLSTTWARWGIVAPGRPPGAAPDVHNAWDAIYSAARYLCGGASEVGDVEAALFRYNPSRRYVHNVLVEAASYGPAFISPGREG